MKIVITGRFSPPVLACMRSWGRAGHKVGFICIDRDRGLNPVSRYLEGLADLPGTDLYTDAGISKISSFLDRFGADVLSCIDDNIACWLSDNASWFNKKVCLAIPSSAMIGKVLSKVRQNRIAGEAGFNVLPEYFITNGNIDDLAVSPEHFPLCLRPSEPFHIDPCFKVKLVYSPDELKHFISAIQIGAKGKIIGQPFKNLPNLVVHGIRSGKKEPDLISAFIVERKFEGVTLTLRPYPNLSRDLADKCRNFVKLFDLEGNFHFEFLFDPMTGDAFFLELNLRFGGTTAKVLACGYDEPLYALEAYGIKSRGPVPEIRRKTVSNKQALLKYIAKACTGKLTALDYPDEPARKKILNAVMGLFLFSDEVLCPDDLRGGIILYLDNIIQNLRQVAG